VVSSSRPAGAGAGAEEGLDVGVVGAVVVVASVAAAGIAPAANVSSVASRPTESQRTGDLVEGTRA
jgi:hypothetical protein